MNNHSIHHLALKVENLKKCEEFYSGLLGLPVIGRHNDEQGNERSVWLGCGDAILMLEKISAARIQADVDSGWHLMALRITAASRKEWKNRLEKSGVKITEESPYSLYFFDPEGNRVALSHYPEK